MTTSRIKEPAYGGWPSMNENPRRTRRQLRGVELPRIQGAVQDDNNHDQQNAKHARPHSLPRAKHQKWFDC